MPAARRFLPLALAGVSAAGLLACGACGRSPSAPLRHVALRRTVTIEVRDSLGLPVPGAALWLTSQFDSAGLVTVLQGDTDDQGRLRRVLAEGGWIAWTGGGGGAAGGSFVVPGGSREPAETLLVRLERRVSARASGVALLANRPDHRGILVSCLAAQPGAVTDSAGAYTLLDLPPGRWSVTCSMTGWKSGIAEVVVPAPGASVVVPAVTLFSDP
ncbi:MAG: hypothetical protein IT347_00230 [Candidatus Eisenbacteria bacterium]|nr:hypothetical protein [Candidatus Eisenbacteria bacterium]